MVSLTNIGWDLVDHPFCTVFILAICWVWIKVFYNELDVRKFSVSINDCWVKHQYGRILSSPFLHVSFVHLALDVSCLWNLRYIEANYGTWFMIKYSLILCLAESLMTYCILRAFSKFIANPILSDVLYRLQSFGTSGLVLAWLAFQSVEVMNEASNSIFLLFGFLSIPSSFAPVVLIGFYYLFSPQNNGVPNSSGMFAGYLLGLGFLKVLDSPYWTVCILFNLAIFFMSSRSESGLSAQPSLENGSVGGFIGEYSDALNPTIAVRYYQRSRDAEFLESSAEEPPNNVGDSAVEMRELSRRPRSSEDDIESKHGEDGREEDSLEPLLSENSGLRNRDTYSSMEWSSVWPFRQSSSTSGAAGNSRRATTVPHRILVNEEDSLDTV